MRNAFLAAAATLLLVTSGCSFIGGGGSGDRPAPNPETLEEARAVWAERSPETYRFRYKHDGCFCYPESLSATVYVRADTVWKFEDLCANGEPASAEEYHVTSESFLTVGGVFEAIEQMASEEQLEEITYNGRLGYPTRAPIGTFYNDGGVVFHLSELERQ